MLSVLAMVISGAGRCARVHTAEILERRSRALGIGDLVPGTLNLLALDPPIRQVLRELEQLPCILLPGGNPKGGLAMWRGMLGFAWPEPGGERHESCALVRLERSTTPYLEVMGWSNYKERYSLEDGDVVTLEIRSTERRYDE